VVGRAGHAQRARRQLVEGHSPVGGIRGQVIPRESEGASASAILGSNPVVAVRSIAALRRREVYCLPCPCAPAGSSPGPMRSRPVSVRARTPADGSLRNRRPHAAAPRRQALPGARSIRAPHNSPATCPQFSLDFLTYVPTFLLCS
jgi:hypothetical protein